MRGATTAYDTEHEWPGPSGVLATTEWLADNIGRPEIRVLDLRWRPDGSAPAVHASGHIPGAALVDWRTDLVEDGDHGETILLVGPDRMAALAARVGIADGTTVVVYDDSQGLFAARAWWSFLAYGLESVRILDGGFPAWAGEGRAGLECTAGSRWAGFHGARPEPDAPDDARRARPARVTRRHAARRASTGRVSRLSRATPSGSATSRARSTSRSGRPASPAASGCVTATSCATSSTARTSCGAGGWSVTTARGSPRPSSRSC